MFQLCKIVKLIYEICLFVLGELRSKSPCEVIRYEMLDGRKCWQGKTVNFGIKLKMWMSDRMER